MPAAVTSNCCGAEGELPADVSSARCLSQGNSSWVCFECRLAVRRPTQHVGDVPCPACGVACWPLGHKIPVPPKRDVEAWRKLLAAETEKMQQRATKATESQVRSRHALEQEIRRLEAMPENAGRASAIRVVGPRLGGE